MINDRLIDDPKLQEALTKVKKIMQRYGYAGACMLVSENEAAFTYGMHAPWSAISPDVTVELGFRIRVNSKQEGADIAHARITAAVHTICQLSDFGEQTTAWMEDLKLMLRKAGIDFEHTPFSGKPLQHLRGGKP